MSNEEQTRMAYLAALAAALHVPYVMAEQIISIQIMPSRDDWADIKFDTFGMEIEVARAMNKRIEEIGKIFLPDEKLLSGYFECCQHNVGHAILNVLRKPIEDDCFRRLRFIVEDWGKNIDLYKFDYVLAANLLKEEE